MITFIKTNLLVLLIGAIIGGTAIGALAYGVHNISKTLATKAHQKAQDKTNQLLSECQGVPKNAITNQFNPDIGKNKKGTIIINTIPEIDNNIKVELSDTLETFKKKLQNTYLKEVSKKQKRRKGNW